MPPQRTRIHSSAHAFEYIAATTVRTHWISTPTAEIGVFEVVTGVVNISLFRGVDAGVARPGSARLAPKETDADSHLLVPVEQMAA